MPRVGFEPTISASKRVKAVQPLEHSATVTGESSNLALQIPDKNSTNKNNSYKNLKMWFEKIYQYTEYLM
jgi:hypothetical protein